MSRGIGIGLLLEEPEPPRSMVVTVQLETQLTREDVRSAVAAAANAMRHDPLKRDHAQWMVRARDYDGGPERVPRAARRFLSGEDVAAPDCPITSRVFEAMLLGSGPLLDPSTVRLLLKYLDARPFLSPGPGASGSTKTREDHSSAPSLFEPAAELTPRMRRLLSTLAQTADRGLYIEWCFG